MQILYARCTLPAKKKPSDSILLDHARIKLADGIPDETSQGASVRVPPPIMRYLVTLAFCVLLLLCCAVLTAPSASAQLAVTGGSERERQEIASLELHDLRGVVIPKSPVALRIVAPDKMLDILHDSNPNVDNNRRNGAVSDDDDSDIDGIYDQGHGNASNGRDAEPTITLLGGEELSEFAHTLVHEYGHHVWAVFMSEDDRAAYRRLYTKQLQAHQLVSDYAEDSPEEGFAEAFAFYLIEPKTLTARDPASYRFLQALVTRLKNANAMDADAPTHAQ